MALEARYRRGIEIDQSFQEGNKSATSSVRLPLPTRSPIAPMSGAK
jgi:hypothetical protein